MTSKRSFIPLVVAVLCCSAVLEGQTRPVAAGGYRYDVTLRPGGGRTLAPERGPFLEARFYNDTDRPVRIPWGSTLFDDMFQFRIVAPDGAVLVGPIDRFSPPVLVAEKEFVLVPPRRSVSYTIVVGGIGRNAQPWFFRKPGEYRVEASYINARRHFIGENGGAVLAEDVFIGELKAGPISFSMLPPPQPQAAAVVGVVVDDQGAPVAGAVVEITSWTRRADGFAFGGLDGEFLKTLVDRQLTDAGGGFVSENLPSAAAKFSIRARHDRFAPGEIEVENVPDRPPQPVTVPMKWGIDVRGRVVDPDGKPIHGVAVRSYPTSRQVYTDVDGQFLIPAIPPDKLFFQFWRPGYSGLDSQSVPPERTSGGWAVTMQRAE